MSVYTYARLKGEYAEKWQAMVINPAHQGQLDAAAKKCIAGKDRYLKLQSETGVPWHFIAILHYRESDCNFHTHLHNGDSLNRRTVQVPAGRPRIARPGEPPFDFDYSAQDALKYQGFTNQIDWSVEAMAYRFEAFNGWGYRAHAVPSAYVWSYSNQYSRGKYVADHVFDSGVVDSQIGTMPLLKTIATMENIPLASGIPVVAPEVPAVSAAAADENPPPLSPKADIARPDNEEMNTISRKHWWASAAQWTTGTAGAGAATVKGLDTAQLEQTKSTIDTIKTFVIDYGFWFGIVIVLGAIAYFMYQKKLIKDDLVSSRYVPSGMAGPPVVAPPAVPVTAPVVGVVKP